MDLIWIIYWIDWLGTGNPFIGIGGVLISIVMVFMVWFAIWMGTNKPDKTVSEEAAMAMESMKPAKPYFVCWIVLCLIGASANAFVPSRDTAYKMLAAYGVTEIAKSDEVKRLGGKSLEVLEKAMDSYLKESESD
jgi:hypothetical protein